MNLRSTGVASLFPHCHFSGDQRLGVHAQTKDRPTHIVTLKIDADDPLATVCKWIDNSPAVAAKHYATSVDLDGDFRRAAGKVAQKAAQHDVKLEATEGKVESNDIEKPPEIAVDCTECASVQSLKVGGTGLEPVTPSVSCWYSSQLS